MIEKKVSISTKIKKWWGKVWGGYCTDCGTKLIFHEDIFNGGYSHYLECPHCDNLDRFNIPTLTYRESRNVGVTVPYNEKTNYIRCLDCGCGIGATDKEAYKSIRRQFVKAHWGHKKEEM